MRFENTTKLENCQLRSDTDCEGKTPTCRFYLRSTGPVRQVNQDNLLGLPKHTFFKRSSGLTSLIIDLMILFMVLY